MNATERIHGAAAFPSDRAMRFLPFLASLGLLVAIATFLGNGYGGIRNLLLDSDRLAPAALYRDWINGTGLSTWVFSSAAFWFPDYPQFFLLRFMSGSTQLTVMCYAIVQVLLLTVGVVALGRQIILRFEATHCALLIALSVWFMAAFPLWIVHTDSFLAAVTHGGVVIALLFTLALAFQLVLAPPARTRWIIGGTILAALSLLMTASDLFYVVQVLIPLTLSLAIPFAAWPDSRRRVAMVLTVLACSSLAGFLLDRLIRHQNDQFMILLAPSSALTSFSVLTLVLNAVVQFSPVHTLLLASLYLACAVILFRQARRFALNDGKRDFGASIFAAFFLLLLPLNVFFVGATGIALNDASLRYFLPTLILSTGYGFVFVMTPLHGGGVWPRRILAAMTLLIVFCAVAQFAWKTPSVERIVQEANYYPPWVACLDEKLPVYGVTHGVATYWQARPITELSHANLTAAQVNRDLTPFHWDNGLTAYRMEPEFIVIDTNPGPVDTYRIDEASTRQRFGPPVAVIVCPLSRTLVYGRPTDTALRNLFKGMQGLFDGGS